MTVGHPEAPAPPATDAAPVAIVPPRRETPEGLADRARDVARRIRVGALGIDEEEASFETHGFTAVDDRAREQLELVGRWFARGFRAALEEPRGELLAPHLEEVEDEFRGFAYEGAATALTVLDALVPTQRRLRSFVRGPGVPHAWIIPIGYGWARTHLRRMPRRPPMLAGPLLDWFAIDGAGFHEGFYKPQRYLDEHRPPRRLSGSAAKVFDQGLGRSLWFYRGGDVERIGTTIDAFPRARRPHVWSGLASAATYAGGVGPDGLEALGRAAGDHALDVAQGAAFAAKARAIGGNPTPHTELACSILCGTGVEEAARLTDAALDGLSLAGHASPYDAWRLRVRHLLAAA